MRVFFGFFRHLIRFIKNVIYRQMQRHKLYNLHSKAYRDCFQKKAKFYATKFRMVEIW